MGKLWIEKCYAIDMAPVKCEAALVGGDSSTLAACS